MGWFLDASESYPLPPPGAASPASLYLDGNFDAFFLLVTNFLSFKTSFSLTCTLEVSITITRVILNSLPCLPPQHGASSVDKMII